MVKIIESRKNPLIKEAWRIKERKEKDYILIEGDHAIEMARASRLRLVRVFFSKRYRNPHFIKELSKETEIIETTEEIISFLSDTKSPQGIVAIGDIKSLIQGLNTLTMRKIYESPLVVICDAIQDPGNLGTIIRTADAAGADAVIIMPGTCDPFMPKVLRASAGSIFNIPLLFSDIEGITSWLRDKGIRLIITSPSGGKRIYDVDLKIPVAFVFGNEARGVRAGLKNRADKIVNIPIMGKAESLNVSVAASVCLYEAVRQRMGRREIG